ncbi:type VII secretion protein EccCa [Dactylosporangium sp. CA-092794]|uniref:type VII secretion protein EccCa n=1 Tax=Dactylosporangium sp. CA-092794 TaxID=3239929 RepID=UPI003D89C969
MLPQVQGGGMRSALTYLPMALMSGVMTLMFVGPARGTATTYLMAGMTVVATGAMFAGQMAFGGGDRKRRLRGERRDYLRHLSQQRRRIRGQVERHREANAWRHPAPGALWVVASTPRRWERRASHPDFLEVRIGAAEQRMAVRIAPMQTKPVEDLEPVSALALRRFIRAYTTVADQPVALYLRGFPQISLSGEPARVRALVRAMIAQIATMHAPEEVLIALCVAGEGAAEWDFAKWLPHVQHPQRLDGAGPVRLAGDSIEAVEQQLGEGFTGRSRFEKSSAPTPDEPFVVIIRDGGRMPGAARLMTTGYRNCLLIDLDGTVDPANRSALRLEVEDTDLVMVRRDHVGHDVRSRLATADALTVGRAAALARILSPYRLTVVSEAAPDRLTANFDLPSLLGIADIEQLDLARAWLPRGQSERLRVPIGIDVSGAPVELDLKESALGGMGPHGLLIGATGSGKSELLRTLVTALALTHSSETLNFVLVDFKGGATFLGLDALPHTSALITNLAGEAALVGRMGDALRGELVRRQELLRAVGGFASTLDYEQARAHGAPLDPLPTLVVVVDEFSELLSAHRDFIDLFVMIGRLGRSLGVHLLLASQRIDDGRLGQLESHLSYRIGLRTFSAMESRAVIGVPDAYELPPSPGNGYLRTDVSTLIRFKAAYVSGPYRRRRRQAQQTTVDLRVAPFTLAHVPVEASGPAPEPVEDAPVPQSTVLALAVSQLVGQGPPAHQVWLPPLGASPSLDELLPTLAPGPGGLRAAGWPGSGQLVVPIGFVDRPFEQARDLLSVDLGGVGGHVGVAGGPQSGKSTLLRTLILALALTHSPRDVQFYCLDFGGGALAALAALPHVGGVTTRLDTDRVARTVAEITDLITRRERMFVELGVDAMPQYRRLWSAGEVPDDPYGDVFLVVDGWFTMRQEFETLELAIRQVAARGLNFGVHLMLSTSRWSEVHHGMRDQIGTRLELRLGDPVDSVVDMRLAATVPHVPGRGLTTGKLHFLAGMPRLGRYGDGPDLAEAGRQLAGLVARFWPGAPAPAVRTLPATVEAAELPEPEGDLRIALGLSEHGLAPAWHDFAETPHLSVLGDSQSGKTSLLRHIARSLTARFTPTEVRIMIVDYRRELFDAVPAEYRLGYSVSLTSTKDTVADAVAGLTPRLPGSDVSPEQLRRRDWWSGPRLYVLVDDYELLSGMDSPLSPLVPLLAQGTDIGFHLVVARSAANVIRSAMDPVIRRVSETNSPEFALSCAPQEGPLLGGAKPRILPPGRALVCTRRGSHLVQLAWSAP